MLRRTVPAKYPTTVPGPRVHKPTMETIFLPRGAEQPGHVSDDNEDRTPRQTPTPGAMSQDRSRELLARIAFLKAEAEKLLEHSRRCCSDAVEMQGLLMRLDTQKAALERILQNDVDATLGDPELDAGSEPNELTEQTARAYLLWLRRLLHELSQAVDQHQPSDSSAPQLPMQLHPPRLASLTGRRRRDAPSRIFPGLEALDVAAVSNDGGFLYRPCAAGGGLRSRSEPAVDAGSWLPLPRQTLYCVVGDAREVAVVGLGGELLTRARLSGDEEDATGTRNLERINFLRGSGRLLLSDFHSLYICDQCCRVLRALRAFGWIVGHCVDEPGGRLFIADRVNEFVSVYGLEELGERDRLTYREFTDGLSSVCILNRQLFVSDRGANAIFAFSADTLEPEFRVSLRQPLFLTTDWRGCIYVTVGGRDNTVKILNSQGQLLRKLSGGRGAQPGQFGSPGGLTVSKDGAELFVCDLDNRRIQVFRM